MLRAVLRREAGLTSTLEDRCRMRSAYVVEQATRMPSIILL